jgi:hypothetical protein
MATDSLIDDAKTIGFHREFTLSSGRTRRGPSSGQ